MDYIRLIFTNYRQKPTKGDKNRQKGRQIPTKKQTNTDNIFVGICLPFCWYLSSAFLTNTDKKADNSIKGHTKS
jgi:hypothetical protein